MNVNEQSTRHAKWQALVEEQEKSGVSQTEFCKQHNIAFSQFGYYRGLLKAKTHPKPKQPPLFSPVQIQKVSTKISEEIKIILPNGFQCYLPASIEITQIKRLMEALLSC
jgi:hypothetical protein